MRTSTTGRERGPSEMSTEVGIRLGEALSQKIRRRRLPSSVFHFEREGSMAQSR